MKFWPATRHSEVAVSVCATLSSFRFSLRRAILCRNYHQLFVYVCCPVASSLMANNNVVIIYFDFSRSLDTSPTVLSEFTALHSDAVAQLHGPSKSLRLLLLFFVFFFCLLPLLLPCLSTRPCCCWMDVCLQIKGLGMRASRPPSCRHFFLFYSPRDERLCLNV